MPRSSPATSARATLFDEALADFAIAYADQTERDHEALGRAAKEGRIKVASDGDDTASGKHA